MTPNLDEIRRALAAASKTSGAMRSRNEHTDARMVLIGNAPTWLAALCDEVEQLEDQIGQLVLDGSMVTAVLADRRAEIARLVAERDAALAEIERIKEINALNGRRCLAWRACADQLDEALREALSYVPKHFCLKHSIGVEALAEYERLKGAKS